MKMPKVERGMGVLTVLGLLSTATLSAQTAVSADGIIESRSGGFQFPDGSLQATASAPGTLPDTGQQGCWDSLGDPIACAGTGQDGELQQGSAWPAPRFHDNGDGTVTDELTGLVWLRDADCFGARTWSQALADANGLMTGACALGDGSVASDWRLPNIRELLSLVDYGESDPALPLGHPFVDLQNASQYWTSTTLVTQVGWAWTVFSYIGIPNAFLKTSEQFVWPVRGGQ